MLRNYVILEEGKPTKMHFIDHALQEREITDPLTGQPKTVKALVFTVDRLGGASVVAYYSTLSDKHFRDFEPFLEGKRYRNFWFTITMVGKGFARSYTVKREPYP